MPSPNKVLKAFGLVKGLNVAGYELDSITIKHSLIIRNQEYSYPIVLTFTGEGEGIRKFKSQFQKLVERALTVNSDYGNPYTVVFGKFEVENPGGGFVLTAEPYAIKDEKLK